MRAASPEHPLMRELMSKAPGHVRALGRGREPRRGRRRGDRRGRAGRPRRRVLPRRRQDPPPGLLLREPGERREPARRGQADPLGADHHRARARRDGAGQGVPPAREDPGDHPPAPRHGARQLLLPQGRCDRRRGLRGRLPLPGREAAVPRGGARHARRLERGGGSCAQDAVGAARGSRRSGNHRRQDRRRPARRGRSAGRRHSSGSSRRTRACS